MNKIYFVLPAYNEEENIEETIKQWYPVVEKVGSDSRLVIANDGSKDGTLAVLNSLKSTYPQLIVLIKRTKVMVLLLFSCISMLCPKVLNISSRQILTDKQIQMSSLLFGKQVRIMIVC